MSVALLGEAITGATVGIPELPGFALKRRELSSARHARAASCIPELPICARVGI